MWILRATMWILRATLFVVQLVRPRDRHQRAADSLRLHLLARGAKHVPQAALRSRPRGGGRGQP
eukprot:494013-Prorocentrum_minimum.AAC.1